MYTLYTGKFTRGLVVEMVMAEAGIDFERREVDILRGEERSPEYLAVNPAGWVPALLRPDGVVLTETLAINLYLGERHRIDSLVPAADDPHRGPFLSGLFYLSGEIEPALKRYWYPHYFGADERTADAIRGRGIEAALTGFGLVERRLAAGGPCYLGERFSLVDLTIAFWVVSLQMPGALRELPLIRGSVEIARARPKLKPLFETLDAWAREYKAR